MSEEYEIIFIPEEGRAIKNNKTGKIYYSEFQIIEEKNKEIDRLNKLLDETRLSELHKEYIINELEKVFIECDYQHLQRKLKSLKEDNK